jgi:dTDP-4-amino-4,6-dideoxygalactose transaminase
MMKLIPFNLPTIDDEEINEVVETLRSGWLTTGPRTKLFESEFAAYVRSSFALAVSSATSGLHLALKALGIGPGDEVITTPLTFCSTVTTILHTGATPVLADIGSDGNIDPDSIEERLTERTRALIPVHLGGLPCDMNRIWSLASRRGIFVIEDAAHAVGSQYQGVQIGGAGQEKKRSDAVVFSFYATKNLTTGEGGMVTTHEGTLEEEMRLLCLHGISKDAWNRYTADGHWHYDVVRCGFKYNLSDIQSAIGIHQLRKQEGFLARRAKHANLYNKYFETMEEVEIPPESGSSRHSWHLYALRLNVERLTISRNQFIEELRRRNICASVHFIPIPQFSFFAPYANLDQNRCPNAETLYPRLVSLPLYPSMSEEQIVYIVESVKDIVHNFRRAKAVQLASATATSRSHISDT